MRSKAEVIYVKGKIYDTKLSEYVLDARSRHELKAASVFAFVHMR